jgi:hypothetical protein
LLLLLLSSSSSSSFLLSFPNHFYCLFILYIIDVVARLNAMALEVMTPHPEIEILDLHKVVTDHCGLNYTDCDWCRKHPCSFHYNYLGEDAQGFAVAEKFREVLQSRKTAASNQGT